MSSGQITIERDGNDDWWVVRCGDVEKRAKTMGDALWLVRGFMAAEDGNTLMAAVSFMAANENELQNCEACGKPFRQQGGQRFCRDRNCPSKQLGYAR